MAIELDATQLEQIAQRVAEIIKANSQGVGDLPVVSSLAGINSLPGLKNGTEVVEAPLSLLSKVAEDAAKEVHDAIADAEDTASHPTYIGTDNYVYVWNKETKAYDKTAIYVRGEGFRISKTYKSVAEMEAETEHGLKDGDFVLINTGDVENPDNAKIYVLTADGKFEFLVDMSGAIGFTGKTPQFSIGTITIGVNRADAGVTLSDDGFDEEGNPKYKLNIKIPSVQLSDLTDAEIALLQSPANDMIAQLEKTDNQVKANEESRQESEAARQQSEGIRQSNEETRKTNETARQESETVRQDNETVRQSNEETRKTNETERKASETERKNSEASRKDNETVRQSNEDTRKSNETTRQTKESERQTNEENRQTNEKARVTNEEGRNTAESTRQSNENIRQTNEGIRQTNESTRMSQETTRQDAEQQRADDYATLRKDIVEATGNANNAADEARHIPKIQDGTWWVYDIASGEYIDTGSPATSRSPQIIDGIWWTWDDANEEYVSTGWAVNSDFELTKEKIEGVFVGDIYTHTHSHLRYKAHVYEETPDFANLATWTDEQGEHPYLVGNGIFVKNTTEPTGYAFYMLSLSTEGSTWVRIPQVPAGYRIVLVKEA